MGNGTGWLALVLSTAAGMATLLGAAIIFFAKSDSKKLLSGTLGFSGGIMITVSLIELFPSSQEVTSASMGDFLGTVVSIACMMGGVLLARLMDNLVPHETSNVNECRQHKNLLRVGMVSAAAIFVHNFPEGIATFMAGYQDINLGLTLAVAIAMHNIPEGVAVALPIYCGTGSKKKALLYTFVAGIAEPVGALIAWLILAPVLSEFLMGIIFAAVAGIMLYISFEELLPSSRQYGYTGIALWSLFLGVCIMPISMAI